ncbi:WD40-repeat-containing domain protein [Schizophyllum commune]
MSNSDFEDEVNSIFDGDEDGDGEIEGDLLDGVLEEAGNNTPSDDTTSSDDSDEDEDEDAEAESEPDLMGIELDLEDVPADNEDAEGEPDLEDEQAAQAMLEFDPSDPQQQSSPPQIHEPTPPPPPQPPMVVPDTAMAVSPPTATSHTRPKRRRSQSPACIRRKQLRRNDFSRPFTVEAIIAIPHPVPTHALASSACISHLLTGSEDGYIRDYDVYTSANGKKNFLTAPQRHHANIIEGTMKAGHLRCWWENPSTSLHDSPSTGDAPLESVYSLAMHSDALWALSGCRNGLINLFTVRHSPGRLCHVMRGHTKPISALALDHYEKGFFSASWDGEAIEWDLNTGQQVRHLVSHGAQLSCIAVRPENAVYSESGSPLSIQPVNDEALDNVDAKSEGSDFDPLFDDEDENQKPGGLAMPAESSAPAPKHIPPVLDAQRWVTFSPDILMTASIDGQIVLWDKRVKTSGYDPFNGWQGVGRLYMSEKTRPWCMSAAWSADGNQVYAARRNGIVEVYDVRQTGSSRQAPRIWKTIRNPPSSGDVSCVVAFPDSKHIACASTDNIRLWNVAETGEPDGSMKPRSGVQFRIIPGHHGGFVSQMLIDPGGRYMVTASSNRGWHGESTRTVLVHEITTKRPKNEF